MNLGKKYLFCLLTCLWLIVIFGLSSQPYQWQTIQPVLHHFFSQESMRHVLPAVSFQYHHSTVDSQKNPFKFVKFLIRKTAHILLYATLAFLTRQALKQAIGSRLHIRLPHAPVVEVVTLLFVGLIAALDEWNQTHVALRTGAVQDVCLDLFAGSIGMMIASIRTEYFRFLLNKANTLLSRQPVSTEEVFVLLNLPQRSAETAAEPEVTRLLSAGDLEILD
ncbi:VanZ family protein [Effusibacillus dendaii]|nr:VanZ family protein [Effusibacillus dendaii]